MVKLLLFLLAVFPLADVSTDIPPQYVIGTVLGLIVAWLLSGGIRRTDADRLWKEMGRMYGLARRENAQLRAELRQEKARAIAREAECSARLREMESRIEALEVENASLRGAAA